VHGIPEETPNIRAASILVVGYEPAMGRMLVNYLNRMKLEVSCAPDARGLLHRIRMTEPDLLVLDPDLEGMDGFELLREVRQKSTVPIIFVSDRDGDEIERAVGLELGADDYVTGPLSLPELHARIRAKLRRGLLYRGNWGRRRGRRYTFEGWVLDQRKRQLLSPQGENIRLSKSQFALLSAFVEAPRQILSRSDLLSATRVHEDVFDRSIDLQVLRLRRKLQDDPRAPSLIRTERGVGYVFEPEVEIG
jgi:two-component system, OmpR family, response regulator